MTGSTDDVEDTGPRLRRTLNVLLAAARVGAALAVDQVRDWLELCDDLWKSLGDDDR